MESPKNQQPRDPGEIPFFPNHFLTEVVVALGCIGIVLLIAGIWPKELGAPANTIMTPARILPEWYFLWLFGLLKIVPELVGIGLAGVLVLGLYMLPWIDRSSLNSLRARRKILILVVVSLILLVVFSVIGYRP